MRTSMDSSGLSRSAMRGRHPASASPSTNSDSSATRRWCIVSLRITRNLALERPGGRAVDAVEPGGELVVGAAVSDLGGGARGGGVEAAQARVRAAGLLEVEHGAAPP